jgi:hypothetical protein
MSEKIYAWLLRLYPVRFREAYRDEVLQLFRDRSRDETGFFGRLRLWMDLLTDLAVSIPRVRRHAGPALAVGGAPSFHVLEDESLRFGAWLLGAVLSLAAFGTGSFLISHGGTRWAISPTGGAGAEDVSSGLPMQQDTTAAVAGLGEHAKLDAAERKRAIDGAIAILKQYYVDPDVAGKMADALRAHFKNGDDNALTDGEAFAQMLTGQMLDVNYDPDLSLGYRETPFPEGPPGPPPEVVARDREFSVLTHCTFEKSEILPGNIGYLKFNAFPDPALCQSTATAAMAKLNDADAIIFDLRYNGSGSPRMVALIATYLFDHPTHLNDYYNRAEDLTEQSWTLAPVPGNTLADKPAYVLTGRGTFSAAEEFSYDLQMLKRATIVGETTGGGAQIAGLHRIDDHFMIRLPEARAINPISKANWQRIGVEPDVKVKAADALATAEELARSKLHTK